MLNGKVGDDNVAATKNTPGAESRVRSDFDQLLNNRKHQNTEVTARTVIDDTLQCIGNLKPNKVAGIDSTMGEHVINSGLQLAVHNDYFL